jgi:hypothetical protein
MFLNGKEPELKQQHTKKIKNSGVDGQPIENKPTNKQ